MALRDWVDIETIQAVSRHISGVMSAIVAFILVGLLIHNGMRDGVLKQTLEIVDGFVLVGLVAILGWKLLMITARGKGYGPHLLVA